MDDPIDTFLLDAELGRLNGAPSDKDRLRLIKNMARNFCFTCEQAGLIVASLHAPASAVDAAEVVCKRLVDPDNIETVMIALHYDESKAELRLRL